MNRIIARIQQIQNLAAKTDWTNLDDPKVWSSYERDLNKFNGKVEDSTGKINPDVTSNRLLQDEDYVQSYIQKRLSEFDNMPDPQVPSDIMYMEVGENGETVKDLSEDDPTKVNRDNEKKPNDAVSSYKVTGQATWNKLSVLAELEKSVNDEIQILTELYNTASKANKFLEKYLGEKEMEARRKHYYTLNLAWQKAIKEIINRTKESTKKLIDVFQEINENGKALYDSKQFNHINKQANEFIRNLKIKISNDNPKIFDILNYLSNTILAGDGLTVNKAASEENNELEKLSFKESLMKLFE